MYLYAFSTPASVKGFCGVQHGPRSTTTEPLRRPTIRYTGCQRRPRRHAAQAVFIWSNGYEEEQDDVGEDSNQADDNNNARGGGGGETAAEGTLEEMWRSWLRPKSEGGGGGVGGTEGEQGVSMQNMGIGDGRGGGNEVYKILRGHTRGPEDLDGLREMGSDSVADAFRLVVTGILGTLPTDAYDVVVTCDRMGVSRMMQSSLSTGYALRNAEIRMLLNDCMNPSLEWDERMGCVTGSGTGVVEWHGVCGDVGYVGEQGLEMMSAKEYIEKLEGENEMLRERLCARMSHGAGENRVIEFMKTLSTEKIDKLQESLSQDGADAFRRTVSSVVGELCGAHIQTTHSMRRDYLGQVALWCLYVGYAVRNIEKRLEMTRLLHATEAVAGGWTRDADLHNT